MARTEPRKGSEEGAAGMLRERVLSVRREERSGRRRVGRRARKKARRARRRGEAGSEAAAGASSAAEASSDAELGTRDSSTKASESGRAEDHMGGGGRVGLAAGWLPGCRALGR
jgi:hypothetical protein